MIVGRWYVQLAAIWHWYLLLENLKSYLSVYCMNVTSYCEKERLILTRSALG